MINKQDDALFDKFNKIFKQQKDKAFSKTCMTECMINFNLSVIFKVTMFQYTCRMIQTALELDSIDMNKEELNCA